MPRENAGNASRPRAEPVDEGLVKLLAENTDLSPNQARDLIRRLGSDKDKLLEAARTFKAES